MHTKAGFKVALVGHSDRHIPPWVSDTLTHAGITFVHGQCHTPHQVIASAGDADVVWTFGSNPAFTAETWRELLHAALPGLARCGAIVRAGSGTDNVPVPEATALGIIVANTPGATAEPVGEYAVALMLAVARQVVHDARQVRAGVWTQPAVPNAMSLKSKTVGLIGFGQIARVVAKRLGGFEPRLLGSDPQIDAAPMREHGVTRVELDELLEQSDIVSIHCPLTESTHHMIGEPELRRMKSSAILINTARGGLVAEAALVRALQEGWIAGAGLDVLAEEPPPADHPLLAMDQVVVTPHVAAFSEQIFTDMWRLSVETILDLRQGRWPRSYVNPQVNGRTRWPMNGR